MSARALEFLTYRTVTTALVGRLPSLGCFWRHESPRLIFLWTLKSHSFSTWRFIPPLPQPLLICVPATPLSLRACLDATVPFRSPIKWPVCYRNGRWTEDNRCIQTGSKLSRPKEYAANACNYGSPIALWTLITDINKKYGHVLGLSITAWTATSRYGMLE